MKRLTILFLTLIVPILIGAETANGTGKTQIDAIINSIDNVLEQKYNIWTASMTEIVNDKMVDAKTISSSDPNAYIKSYKIMSLTNKDGVWTVTADVTTDRSSTYLKPAKKAFGKMAEAFKPRFNQSKQPVANTPINDSQEFKPGQELDKKLLNSAIDKYRAKKESELQELLVSLLEQYQEDLFDYNVKIEKKSNNTVKVKVSVNKNDNTYNMAGIIQSFLYSSSRIIDCNPTEVKDNAAPRFTFGMPSTKHLNYDSKGDHFFSSPAIGFRFYNQNAEKLERAISTIVTSGIFGFKIIDNLGNEMYIAVTPNGQLKSMGNFTLNPECSENLPSYCGLGNTNILIHNFKSFMDSKTAAKLEFTIPYSATDFEKLEDVTLVPFNQNLSGLW